MKQKQRILGTTGTLLFLVLISSFPPLSTDLYLPALPQMLDALNTTQSRVNLTLSMFFVFFAGGLLFWGPLSEKYGRKPVLITGLIIYIISSVMCAVSQQVDQLVISRISQAFGGSGAMVVATALVKDLYDGREREKVMALVMSMVVIAPIAAPVIGALLLKYASWRTIFLVLAGVGTVALVGSLVFQETLEERYERSVFRSWGRLGIVLKNPGFLSLLFIFSMIPMTILTFLAASSFIYINGFGMNEQEFSYFLAFNALFAMAGPMLYIRLSRYFKSAHIVSVSFGILTVCGFAVATTGGSSPYLFALLVGIATLAVITMRVPGTNLMLEQQEHDTGSAAALINFCGMVMGSVGMFLVSLIPDELITVLGSMQTLVGLTGGVLWLLIRNRRLVLGQPHKIADRM